MVTAKNSVKFTPKSSKPITVKVDFKGTDKYKESTLTKVIQARHRTSLKIGDIGQTRGGTTVTNMGNPEYRVGDVLTIPVTLTDNENSLTGSPTVTVNVGSTSQSVTCTTTNGSASGSTTYTIADNKKLNISASYTQTSEYFGASTSTSIKPVYGTTLKLTPDKTSVIVGDTVTMSITLTDTGKTLTGSPTVNVTLPDNTIKTVTLTTSTTGTATGNVTYTVTGSGSLKFSASYTGNTDYAGTSNSYTITSDKISTTLSVTSIDTKPTIGEETSITFKLTDANNTLSTAQTIVIHIGGNEAQLVLPLTTNGTCTGTFKYTPSTTDSATLIASYDGDSTYSASSLSSEYEIMPRHGTSMSLSTTPENPAVNAETTLNIELTDNDGALDIDPEVDVDIGGETQTITLTNSG